jgi:hypothetical protein
MLSLGVRPNDRNVSGPRFQGDQHRQLLRARRERPRGCRSADKRDDSRRFIRPPIVDGGQPSLEPVADGVLVQAEQPRDLLDRVVPVDLHQPGVGMAMAHPSARLLPGQAFGQPGIGVRGVTRNT